MPVVIQTREYDEEFYQAVINPTGRQIGRATHKRSLLKIAKYEEATRAAS